MAGWSVWLIPREMGALDRWNDSLDRDGDQSVAEEGEALGSAFQGSSASAEFTNGAAQVIPYIPYILAVGASIWAFVEIARIV